jgi:alkylation response protein AidB-like acyl-CoA dehydrogenase
LATHQVRDGERVFGQPDHFEMGRFGGGYGQRGMQAADDVEHQRVEVNRLGTGNRQPGIEPAELGFASRYLKAVRDLEETARQDPSVVSSRHADDLAWAYVQAEMLRNHTARRLSERFDGVVHGSDGSIDKLLMTWAEQTIGHTALSSGVAGAIAGGSTDQLDFYLYSRAQSVMGGTSQVQKNIIATRILDLPVS